MAEKKKLVSEITSMDVDFAQWYTDIVKKAEMADYSSVKGCIIMRPYAQALWENIQHTLDGMFKETGHENVAMPIFIPESLLQKEADHVEGFAPECAWVTHGGNDKLEERLAWVRQLLEVQQDSGDAQDIVRSIKSDIAPEECFVFTPKGDVINLPTGSTVIDFAYAIHSAVGNHMVGAKVNNRIVTFDHVLKNGDIVIAGTATGRVRMMTNDKGERVNEAGPSFPVEIMGLSEAPNAGDVFNAVADEKLARELVEQRKAEEKAKAAAPVQKVSLENLFDQIQAGERKELALIVKADVQGSVEAVKASLEKLSNDEGNVRVIHGGVGAINESDVTLAATSNAIIIGFNIRPDASAREAAEREGVDVRLYRVIYQAIEDVQKAMKGLLEPEYKEVILGHAEVRNTFRITGAGTVAGCYVKDGKLQRNAEARLIRDNVVVFEGKLSSLKRFKDDAKEVAEGYECGVSFDSFNDIKEGDVIECYVMEEVER